MTSISLAAGISARSVLDPGGRPADPLVTVPLDDLDWSGADALAERLANLRAGGHSPVLVGLATTQLPVEAAPVLAQLTVTLGGGLAPWCAGAVGDLDAVRETVRRAPYACMVLDQVVRATSAATLDEGLMIESLAYSMLLAAPEFLTWRRDTPRRATVPGVDPVLVQRSGSCLSITLNRPERHNAFGRAVRDGLIEALELARMDDSVDEVVVRGAGPSFCSGGDLDEFGTTPDVATAHLVRVTRSAGRSVSALGSRIRFELHGACIGAGIEVPAFGQRLRAHPGTGFRLPELRLGLIPGAGGTVSITRRIGRWRTAWMALTDHVVDARTALTWGLVDELG